MTEKLLLEEIFRKRQEINSKMILQNFVLLHKDFDPSLISEELMEAGILNWFSFRRINKTSCFCFKQRIKKRQQIFIAEAAKSGYTGLRQVVKILETDLEDVGSVTPHNSSNSLNDLLEWTLKLHCKEILNRFVSSPAGELFDPRIFTEDLKNHLPLTLYHDLKNEASRKVRVEEFATGFGASGLSGLAAFLEALRRRLLGFEAIYLHQIIRKGPEKKINRNKISEIAKEAHLDNELWIEEYESIPRIKERLRIKKFKVANMQKSFRKNVIHSNFSPRLLAKASSY
jgi:hypothetical protein